MQPFEKSKDSLVSLSLIGIDADAVVPDRELPVLLFSHQEYKRMFFTAIFKTLPIIFFICCKWRACTAGSESR